MMVDRGRFDARLTRRTLVAGSAAVMAVGGGSVHAMGQGTTPAPENPDAFAALTERVVGVQDLSEELLQQSWQAITRQEDRASALNTLLDAGEDADLGNLPDSQQEVVTTILEFWYLGNVDGEPVENRSEIFAQLVAYQALPYSTLPAVCKSWGYWAVDPELPDRE